MGFFRSFNGAIAITVEFNEELSSFFNVACLRALLKKSYTVKPLNSGHAE